MSYNKIAQGMISLIAIVVLLCSILAGSLFYQNGATGNAVREDLSNYDSKIEIQELNNINSLSQLNEGWYKIANGYVYYADSFNSLIPLYIKIKNPSGLNGIAVVDADGKVTFDSNEWNIPQKQADENKIIENKIQTNGNKVTGDVTGLEKISGMQAATNQVNQRKNENLKALEPVSGGLKPNNDKYGSYSFKDTNDKRKVYVQSDGSLFISSGKVGDEYIRSATYNQGWKSIETPRDSYIPFKIYTTVKYSNGNSQQYYLKDGKWYLNDGWFTDTQIYTSDINQYVYDKYKEKVTSVESKYVDTTNSGSAVINTKNSGEFRTYIADRYLKSAESYGIKDSALAYLEEAAKANPPDGETLNRIGNSYFRWGEKDQAVAFYQKALATDGNNVDYIRALNIAKRNSIEGWNYNGLNRLYSRPTKTAQAESARTANIISIDGFSYDPSKYCYTKGGYSGCFYEKPDGSIYYESGQNDPRPTQYVKDGKPYRADNNVEITDPNAKVSFTPQERARKQYVGADGTVSDNLPSNVGLGNMFTDDTLYLTSKDGQVRELTKKADGKYYYDDNGQYAAVKGGEVVLQQPKLPDCCPAVLVEYDKEDGKPRYDIWYNIEGSNNYAYYEEKDDGSLFYIQADYTDGHRLLFTQAQNIVQAAGTTYNIISSQAELPENSFITARDTDGVERKWVKLPGGTNNAYYTFSQDIQVGTIRANYNPNTEILTPYAATGKFDVPDFKTEYKSSIPLTEAESTAAETANGKNAQQTAEFKKYLKQSQGKTNDEADKILKDPQQIADWQLFLGLKPDGVIGQETVTAISSSLPRVATQISSTSGTSRLQTVDEVEAYVLSKTNDDQKFLDKAKEIVKERFSAKTDEEREAAYISLLKLMDFESAGTFNPTQPNLRNPNGAIGLIQFTQPAIDDLNKKFNQKYTKESLAQMNREEQMVVVGQYIEMWQQNSGKDLSLPFNLAAAVIAPAKIGEDADAVAYAKGSPGYDSQPYLDKNHDGKITLAEYAVPALGELALQGTYDSFDVAQAKFKAEEYTIGDVVKIAGKTYVVRGTIPSGTDEPKPVLYDVDSGTNFGETFDGKGVYFTDRGAVITSYKREQLSTLQPGFCLGNTICNQEGTIMPYQERQNILKDMFYVRLPSGAYQKVEGAVSVEDAQNKYADIIGERLPAVSGDKLTPQQLAQTSAAGQQATQVAQKLIYVYQLKKPDGTFETRTISVDPSADENTAKNIANANAAARGGAVVDGTVQRQKYTVTINGIAYTNIPANSEDEAKNIAKGRFATATGVNPSILQPVAKRQEIGEDPSKQTPKEYKIVYLDEKNEPIDKEKAQALEDQGIKVKTIIVSPDQKTTKIANSRGEAESFVEQENTKAKQAALGKSAQQNAASQGIKQFNDKDENGIQYAQGNDGRVYQFDEKSNTYKPIPGNDYDRYRTIGTGADAIIVTETIDANTKRVTNIELKKSGETVTVDLEILGQIEKLGAKGVTFKEIPRTDSQEGQQIINFKDKNGNLIEIKLSTDYGYDAQGKITGKKSYSVSKYDSRGQQTEQTITTTTRDNSIELTETQTIQKAGAKIISTLVERTLKKEGSPDVNIQFSTTGGQLPSDDSSITINGNTISYKTFKDLGLTTQLSTAELYSATSSISTLLTEARNFGIDLSTAKATFKPAVPAQTPVPQTETIQPKTITAAELKVGDVMTDNGQRIVSISPKDENGKITFQFDKAAGSVGETQSLSADYVMDIPIQRVTTSGTQGAQTSTQSQSGIRTLTSPNGLKSTSQRDDGTIELEERITPNAVKSRTTINPDGSVTQTTCKDSKGCAKDADGKLEGQFDVVQINKKDKTILSTSSTFTGKDGTTQKVEIQYGNPEDLTKDTYIKSIQIASTKYNLGEPENGYQAIQEMPGRYYKDGKIYFKDANGKYGSSPYPLDKEIEKEFEDAKIENQKKTADSQREQFYQAERKAERVRKVQNAFATAEKIFTEFRGLGYYASLFIDEKDLLKWRNDVDEIFSKWNLGTEYWTSRICTDYANLKTDNEGVAYAETPQGLAQVAAHIEATITPQIINEKGEIGYIYKITFQVRNGDFDKDPRAPENMTINVLIRNGGTSVQIFKKSINIGRGNSFGRFGSQATQNSAPAIVKESKNIYKEICITFDKIPSKWKIKNNILCNKVVPSTGEPTPFNAAGAQTPQGTDADLNDF